ncbi:hypothetical protein F5887DRAFT_1284246 [Amanita rubescens]|nr:hypothetical protein F5887DRAFT_1284246 [Amanita rubescens]
MLPQHILDRFNRLPRNPRIKNKYHGTYSMILTNVCFPEHHHFAVEPQYPLPKPGVPTIDFVVTYLADLPVFFLEVKPPYHVDRRSLRIKADEQMRARLRALRLLTPIPRIHGVSVMGRRLAFYGMDTATGNVNPNYVAQDLTYVTDTVPAERWDTDITTEDGYQRFMGVINDVIAMAAALHHENPNP